MLRLYLKKLISFDVNEHPSKAESMHDTYWCCYIRIFEALPDEISPFTRYMRILNNGGLIWLSGPGWALKNLPVSQRSSTNVKSDIQGILYNHIQLLTTSSPLPFRSPLRTLARVSSFLPFPSVALWISVAKKQTEDKTRGSKAACTYPLGKACYFKLKNAVAYSKCLRKEPKIIDSVASWQWVTYKMTSEAHSCGYCEVRKCLKHREKNTERTSYSSVAILQWTKKVDG